MNYYCFNAPINITTAGAESICTTKGKCTCHDPLAFDDRLATDCDGGSDTEVGDIFNLEHESSFIHMTMYSGHLLESYLVYIHAYCICVKPFALCMLHNVCIS